MGVASEFKPSLEDIRAIPVKIINWRTCEVLQRSISAFTQVLEHKCVTNLAMAISSVLAVVDGDAHELLSPGMTPYTILVQGIEPPLTAPLFELWNLLHHADLFLYVMIHENRR